MSRFNVYRLKGEDRIFAKNFRALVQAVTLPLGFSLCQDSSSALPEHSTPTSAPPPLRKFPLFTTGVIWEFTQYDPCGSQASRERDLLEQYQCACGSKALYT
jgi:hypothetical protein